jgi:hypothetical protein
MLALRSEASAYDWYNSRLSKRIDVARDDRKSYFQLKLEFIGGYQTNNTYRLVPNEELIRSAVEHYCVVWGAGAGQDKPMRMHGDLTLSNIIFTAAGPVFIDWEHSVEVAFPVGFDALHLLYSSLLFETNGASRVNTQVARIMSTSIRTLLASGCCHPCYQRNPLIKLLELIRANIALWRLPEEHRLGKLPVLRCTVAQALLIDQQISAA